MVNISIVVVAKNEQKFIKKCLECLKKQTLKAEIIVVDGHSTDKTFSIAKKYADKVVYDNRKGIADARNVGAETASGDIVAYTDADSRPKPDWTKKILENMKGKIAISGPIMPYDGSKSIKRNLKFWTGYFFRLANKLKYPCFCGPNMAFKKDILLKYRFKTNMIEDFEIGNRLKKYGNVEYVKDMMMPISSRRFKDGFYGIALKYYINNYIKLKMGKKLTTEYFKKIKNN